MDINKLLDTVKLVCQLRTDGELAVKLGVSKQAISSYRNGHRLPDPVQCETIANLSGLPLAQVLGVVGEARAISRDEKAVWRKLAATAALLAVVVFPALPASAHSVREALLTTHSMHYAKRRRIRWAYWKDFFLSCIRHGMGEIRHPLRVMAVSHDHVFSL